MAKIVNIADIAEKVGSGYPPPHDAPCANRANRRLADAVGIDQFGVNLTRLPPGTWSSQRHWHSDEDELVHVVSGTLVWIDDDGERTLVAGDIVGCKAGDGNAHHMINRSDAEAVIMSIGTRSDADICRYPDIGMRTTDNSYRTDVSPYVRADGSPWPTP